MHLVWWSASLWAIWAKVQNSSLQIRTSLLLHSARVCQKPSFMVSFSRYIKSGYWARIIGRLSCPLLDVQRKKLHPSAVRKTLKKKKKKKKECKEGMVWHSFYAELKKKSYKWTYLQNRNRLTEWTYGSWGRRMRAGEEIGSLVLTCTHCYI